MFGKMEEALGRKLTTMERSKLEWLYGYSKDNREVFEKLFSDMFRAGQDDAEACQEAMERGTARE